ncbi:adenylate cyclase [Candidatus Sumerlaeota bacterium]|nr:adenylate cyclase [Candidatus Sumerlaeota bacterium]
MPMEIERKFHVHRERLPRLDGGERYIQGYLQEDPQIRFRVIDGQTVVLCVKKFFAPGERFEFEAVRESALPDDIEMLCRLALWAPVIKTRHKFIGSDGFIWELDVYEGKNNGLITAEVETPSMDNPIQLPAWIDVEREITQDSRYANLNLSRHPYSEWSEEEKKA